MVRQTILSIYEVQPYKIMRAPESITLHEYKMGHGNGKTHIYLPLILVSNIHFQKGC